VNNSNIRIAITSGDQDGIGPEVTAKALAKIGPQRGVHFYLWRAPVFQKKYLSLINKRFKRKTFNSWSEAFKHPLTSHRELVEINSMAPPPKWVETAAEAGKFGHIQALVTAPLSKTLIVDSGMKDIGHTEILSRVCMRPHLFMAFLGNKFSVILGTGHIPLRSVNDHLDKRTLKMVLRAAHSINDVLNVDKKAIKAKKGVALVGINPHASENGLIGDTEIKVFLPALFELQKEHNLKIAGPLVPDAAFLQKNWNLYNVYVCPYHDQGLIPFKVVHQHKSGCHMTMGLPFIRTSVEHGTAKDIFGKNLANESSMIDAIQWAIHFSKNSFKADSFLTESNHV
jgi:4-hydroxythreonine-4-phosphate dehydrogenase